MNFRRRRLALAAGAVSLLGLFVKLTEDVLEQGDLKRVDAWLMHAVEAMRIPALNGAAVDLTALGSPTLITLVTVIGAMFLAFGRDARALLYLVTCSAGAGILTLVIKYAMGRERPQLIPRLVEVSGASYPSGHSVAASSLYLALAFLAARHFPTIRARVYLFTATLGLIFCIGASRVYLGVHYPSDVASGIFLGTGWAMGLAVAFKIYGHDPVHTDVTH